MAKDCYGWNTWFYEVPRIMCHKFNERVTMKTELETGLIRIFKDDVEIRTIDGSSMTLKEYEELLVKTAKEASMLIINQ